LLHPDFVAVLAGRTRARLPSRARLAPDDSSPKEVEAISELALHFDRLVPVPAPEAWRMHTDPNELARWWGPRGFTNVVESDLRVGGSYRITMTPPGGDAFHLRGEFTEVVACELLGYTFVWAEPDVDDVANRVTIALEPRGRSTLMTIDHRPFKTEARRALHDGGWSDSLEKLERLLGSAP
jgi:uncharacterized protein YndB with AHSA1/START domain